MESKTRACVKLIKGEGRVLKAGGLWVYDNEIALYEGSYENGDLIDVFDFDDYFLGTGFINMNSKIRVRLLCRKRETLSTDDKLERLIEKRVTDAWEYRKKTVDISSCRVIFGEADFLPGIVIDKFSDVLVLESLALGIDKLKTLIISKLREKLLSDNIAIKGVYERSDAKVREQEGMERFKGFIGESFSTKVEIIENDVKYIVDIEEGQKTGFFLDQKYNRKAIQRLCMNARVLDCFTHTGSFALNAAKGGAREVIGVDASEIGCELARENARLNSFDERVSFVCDDVFEYLPKLEQNKEIFDLIILDPPAFTKSRKSIKNATKGYREINMRAMKLIRDGGYLATCSCSHFMTEDLFTDIIGQAAKSVHKRLKQVEFRTQSPDHPILWAADESYYLKFYIFQVVDEK